MDRKLNALRRIVRLARTYKMCPADLSYKIEQIALNAIKGEIKDKSYKGKLDPNWRR